MDDNEQTGPIDWILIEAPGHEVTGVLVPPLLDLVNNHLVRILDALVIVKRGDGDFDALTTDQLDDALGVGDIGQLAGASSGLLSPEDAAAAAAALQSDSLGLVIVYENLWSKPFADALRGRGGQLVARGQIETQTIVEVLDALGA
jgi:hypothetical protein